MRRFNVLHTIETGGPGGAETVLLELASRINPDKFRSIVLLPGGTWLPQQLEARGVPVILASSKNWYDTTLLRTMTRTIRSEGIDLIHSHLADQNFYGCLAGRRTGKPIIVTYHGRMGFSDISGFRSKLKSWFVRRYATAVVVVSDYLRKTFESGGFAPEKISRIYNGVELDRLAQACPTGIREELKLESDAKLVGMVANLRRPKGYQQFVAAARVIADEFPKARFLAVGDADVTIEKELKEQIKKLGLDVKFLLMGFRADVPAILRNLDVFVLSSVDEGLSIATIEAMGAAKPVVVTRSGGPEEIVADGRTGFLVPSGNPQALAERVCEILRDPQTGARLGEAARKDVEARFSISKMMSEYESLYLRCLNAD